MPDGSGRRRPTLSLCVITKDEEANLPRCLRSVRGLVDDIVVTDSGSTDRTVEIAEAAGARVIPFVWCDDFSAAYNEGLGHATGDWILILDADEELAPGSGEIVRSLIGNDDAFAYSLYRRDYFGHEVRDDAQSEMLQTRLIRRRDDVRFVGRIHQQLEPSLSRAARREGRRVLRSEARFLHYGYMGDQQTRKLERSIRLLEMELRDRPDQFYYLVELGRSKLAAGDASGIEPLGRAAELLESDDSDEVTGSPMVALLLEQLLAIDRMPEGFPMDGSRIEEVAAARFASSVPLLLQRARRAFVGGDHAGSAALIERAQELAESGAYDRACSFDPAMLRGEAVLNLGVCYAHLGRLEASVACFDRLSDHPRHGEAARRNAAAVRGLMG